MLIDHVYSGFAVPVHGELSRDYFVADFFDAFGVYGECVVVEGELAFAVFVLEVLDFVYDVFGASAAVSSAEHAYGGAEVAPVNASAAGL